MVQVLQIPQNKAFKTFAFLSLAAPVSGVISGGVIFDKLGGYNSYKALHVLQLVGFAASITGVVTSLAPSYPLFFAFMFLQLFFGGMVMPVGTGIMLN
jgi:MFS transporter, Spinster family, sphingosine-1-phosphate transporter